MTTVDDMSTTRKASHYKGSRPRNQENVHYPAPSNGPSGIIDLWSYGQLNGSERAALCLPLTWSRTAFAWASRANGSGGRFAEVRWTCALGHCELLHA
jgi:hypothetical protein